MSNTFQFTIGHKVLENSQDGFQAIMLTDESYDGIIFTYGRVSVDESEDAAKLSFEYQIHDDNGIDYVKEELEHTLGLLLEELIVYGVTQNNLVYSGGVDDE